MPGRQVCMYILTSTSFISLLPKSCQYCLSFSSSAVAEDHVHALVNTMLLAEVPEERLPKPSQQLQPFR